MHPRLFEEVQIVGAKKIVKQTQAERFPEMMFIRDLILKYEHMADTITEEEYEAVKEMGI